MGLRGDKLRTTTKIILVFICLIAAIAIDNGPAGAQTYNAVFITGIDAQPNPVMPGATTTITINTFEFAQWFWLDPTTMVRPTLIVYIAGKPFIADMTSEQMMQIGFWGSYFYWWYVQDGIWTHQVVWDGKDLQGNLVPPGPYLATVNVYAGGAYTFGSVVLQNGYQACALTGVTLTPSSVVPQKTTGITTANVAVSLANPAPSGGCTGRLRVEPVENSGGHQHNENRQNHTGRSSLNAQTYDNPISIYIPAGEITSAATYSSGEVSGTERIIAEILDGGNIISSAAGTVDVKVPDLQPLGGFISYQLTGARDAHPANHYGTASTVTNIGRVADAFYIANGELLGINDMSLVWGGLFDIGPPPSSNVFWYTPHTSHRKGTSVDIDLCALSTIPNDPNPQTCVIAYDENDNPIYRTCDAQNYVCVPADMIVTLCLENGNATMANELTHHCEFPQ